MKRLKSILVAATALSAAVVAGVEPALAGGRYDGYAHGSHFRPVYVGGPVYRPHYRPHYRHAYGPYHGRGHSRGGISGGEAALIAAGIIGGVILIDQAIESNRRAAEPVYRQPYPPRYPSRPYRSDRDGWYDGDSDRYDEARREIERQRREIEADRRRLEEDRRRLEEDRRRFEGEGDGDFRQFRDDAPLGPLPDEEFDDAAPVGRTPRPRSSDPLSDPLDDQLLGASDARLIESAYAACAAETRAASEAGQLMIALPAAPGSAARVEGGAYRLRADFTVQQAAGASHRRTMECEADDRGVLFLEIV